MSGQRPARAARVATRLEAAIGRLPRWIVTMSLVVGAIALVILLGVVLVGVVGRDLPGAPVSLPHTELAGYLLAAIVFLGLAGGFHDGFPRVTPLYGRLRGRSRRGADLVLNATALLYVVVLTVYTWRFVSSDAQLGTQTNGVLRISLYIPELALPVGLTVFCVYLACEVALCLVRIGRVEDGAAE